MARDIPAVRMVYSVVDRASAPLRAIRQRMRMMSNQAQRSMRSSARANLSVARTAAATVAAVAGVSIRQRGNTEDALGELSSLGVKKLGVLTNAARDFSNRWSRTTRVDFLKAAYDIKSGISSLSDDGVADFTRLAAMTATATKATTGEMTSLFAQAYNIYRKQFGSDQKFGQAFSAGISESVKRFRTDGKKMTGAIGNLGGVASSFGVQMSEQIAVLGYLQNTINSGEEAGTGYKAVMLRLIEAGTKLGTSFVDTSGKALPLTKVLAKISNEMKRTEKAGKKKQFMQALKVAFGEEGYKIISLLLGQYKDLQEHIDGVSKAMTKGETHTRLMASEQEKGSNRSTARMINSLSNLAGAIGEVLSPAVEKITNSFAAWSVRMQKVISQNPGLVKAVAAVTTVVIAFVAALGAAKIAMLALAVASAMNPMVWIAAGIVAAIAAIIAAAAALYYYWDDIVGALSFIWDDFVGGIKSAVTAIDGYAADIRAALASFGNFMDGLVAQLKFIWDDFAASFDPAAWLEVGKNFVGGLWDGVKSVWGKFTAWLWSAWEKATSWLPDVALETMGLKSEGAKPKAAAPSASAKPRLSPSQVLAAHRDANIKSKNDINLRLRVDPYTGRYDITGLTKKGDGNVNVLAGANFGAGY